MRSEDLTTMIDNLHRDTWRAGQDPAADPYPFQRQVDELATRQLAARVWAPSPDDYLDVAEGVVRHYAQFQRPDGAIVEPQLGVEAYYATPQFAAAAAQLVATGRAVELADAAVRAWDRAVTDLAGGTTPVTNGIQSPDFYPIPLFHSFGPIADLAPRSLLDGWRAELAGFDPEQRYERTRTKGRYLNNWSLINVTGEALRCRAGLGGSDDWIADYLGEHLLRFTPAGMYVEPYAPPAYDSFARFALAELIAHGYDGEAAASLHTLLARGAMTSALLLSPVGEWLPGGRSANHVWSEAAAILGWEIAAHSLELDDAWRGMLRRSAGLALQSIRRWVRPDGDLAVVKNHLPHSARHGYELYSYPATYNLLVAYLLTNAAGHVDPRPTPVPAPAERGGYVVDLRDPFHLVVANAGGLQAVVDTGAQSGYGATGLIRVSRFGVAPAVAIGDGSCPRPDQPGSVEDLVFLEPYASPATHALACGPAFQVGAGWRSLAALSRDDLSDVGLVVSEAGPRRILLRIDYRAVRALVPHITETYELTPDAVHVSWHCDDFPRLRLYLPFLFHDGSEPAVVRREPGCLEVTRQAATLRYRLDHARVPISLLGTLQATRRGQLDAGVVEVDTPVTVTIELAQRSVTQDESAAATTVSPT